MDDIAPALLSKIRKAFEKNVNNTKGITELYQKVADGKADYSDAYRFSDLMGMALAKSLKVNIDELPNETMYYNIAQKVLEPMLKMDYEQIADICQQVQTNMNKLEGVSIKGLKPDLNKDRIEGLVSKVSSDTFDKTKWVLDAPIREFSNSVVDDSIKKNAEFQSNSGLKVTITRTLGGSGCCKWCEELEGIYYMPDVPSEVFMRHDNCECQISVQSDKSSYYMGRSGRGFTR